MATSEILVDRLSEALFPKPSFRSMVEIQGFRGLLSFDFVLHIRDKMVQVFAVFLHEVFWES